MLLHLVEAKPQINVVLKTNELLLSRVVYFVRLHYYYYYKLVQLDH